MSRSIPGRGRGRGVPRGRGHGDHSEPGGRSRPSQVPPSLGDFPSLGQRGAPHHPQPPIEGAGFQSQQPGFSGDFPALGGGRSHAIHHPPPRAPVPVSQTRLQTPLPHMLTSGLPAHNPSLGRASNLRLNVEGIPSAQVLDVHREETSGSGNGNGNGGNGNGNGNGDSTQADPNDPARGVARGKRVVASDVLNTRPATCESKRGTAGNNTVVQANYFRVVKKPNWSIFQYRVDFSPEVDNLRLRNAYLYQHQEKLGGFIFDGTVLFTTNKLYDDGNLPYLEIITKNREEQVILIKIKKVGVVEHTNIQQLQILNLILRRSMRSLGLQLVMRNYFDPGSKIALNAWKMEVWPGYQTSIRQHEKDVLLCAEISHKIMRTDTLYFIMKECTKESKNYAEAFKRAVIGTVVLTEYNNKTYRIDDVDFDKNPMSTFQTRDSNVSYMDYYKERYNLIVRDRTQPLLLSRPTERNIRGGQTEHVYLIPELCRATGMTDEMRQNFRLMKDLSEYTRLAPNKRIERLMRFNKRLQDSKESMETFKNWNMSLDSKLVEVNARNLSCEKILFGRNKVYTCDNFADWTREFRNASMYKQVDIKRWTVVTPYRSLREVQNFVKCCENVGKGMNMQIDQPKYEELPDDKTGTYPKGIEKATRSDPQILMVVITAKNEEKYSCIKKLCCVDNPVPSQVVTLRTIAPKGEKAAAGLMSIATKVVIQMNAKILGVPWMIDMPANGLMTIGFDVCHSGKEKNKSFGALVASMDIKRSPKYFSHVSQHMKGQELSNDISTSIMFAVHTYQKTHGALPERIIFYRDGVGDGQLNQVYNTEVAAVKNKLDAIYKESGSDKKARLSFIVVTKRINTRFFQGGKNPPPGTIVDDVITLPERYDFFLVSQSVRQGTVSPTAYNVLYDTSGFTPNQIQLVTYKMTHLYYNWSGTCRVPAVCQYAHKLAFLYGESIHRAPEKTLQTQLYFL